MPGWCRWPALTNVTVVPLTVHTAGIQRCKGDWKAGRCCRDDCKWRRTKHLTAQRTETDGLGGLRHGGSLG